jgi:membrane dipeptidase
MTLTHNNHTSWADAAMASEPGKGGLTAFGEEVVAEMNRLGMLIDLSHAHPDTMRDAIRVSKAPVIFSHSNARALTEIPRNVPDDVIRMLPANGGVLMVSFVSPFTSQAAADVAFPAMKEYLARAQGKSEAERMKLYEEITTAMRAKMPAVTVAAVVDHMEYIKKLVGVDHIGIGSDYDGNDSWPTGLEDASKFPNLVAELVRRGWSDEDILKVIGGNVLRALEQTEAVARAVQKASQD